MYRFALPDRAGAVVVASVLALAFGFVLVLVHVGGDHAASAADSRSDPNRLNGKSSVLTTDSAGHDLTQAGRADGTVCLAYNGASACGPAGENPLDGRTLFSFTTGRAKGWHVDEKTGATSVDEYTTTAVVGIASGSATAVEVVDSTGARSRTALVNGAFIVRGSALGNGTILSVAVVDEAGATIATDG